MNLSVAAAVLAGLAAVPLVGGAQSLPVARRICDGWTAPDKIGALDMAKLANTSGLAASRRFPGWLYHHNDAQGGPSFFTSRFDGSELREIRVEGFAPKDLEDVAVGPCAGGRDPATCLYIADIGDNAVNRSDVTIAVVAEPPAGPGPAWSDTVRPLRVQTAKYPDGPHNAEGLAVSPQADVYVMTKASRTEPETRIFRLTRDQMRADGVQTFSEVMRFDLTRVMTPPGTPAPTRQPMATGMDISPDGGKFVVLTLNGAVEFTGSLPGAVGRQDSWADGDSYRRILTAPLPQAEGVAYAADGNSIYYTSEFMRGGPESPIWRQRCLVK